MSLIRCPECNKEISNKSNHCIFCGCPISELCIEKYYKLVFIGVKKGMYIKVNCLIEDVTNYWSRDVCDIMDYPPNTITTGLTLSDAEKLQNMFTEKGATTVIKEDPTVTERNDVFAKMEEYARKKENGTLIPESAANINRPKPVDNRPKCPICNSTNIQKIGGVERATSIAAFGIFSKKINKSFKCNNCGGTF